MTATSKLIEDRKAMSKTVLSSLAVAAALLTTACGKEAPSGQVAATVNGKEVTLQEVNTEIQASKFPSTMDKKVAQQIALQRVIDRKLVLGSAAEQGLDKSPEYLSQKRRGEEMLLAQIYARKQLAGVQVPSDADVTKFMTDHPNAFARREQLTLDQIRFPLPADPKRLAPLKNDHDMAAVAATLTRLGIRFERGTAGLDTAALPQNIMQSLNALPAGEPFALPADGLMTVNVVQARRPITAEGPQARTEAVNAWRQEKFASLLTQQVETLRKGAKIEYQGGFGPPADAAAAGAKPATASSSSPAPRS